MPTHFIRLVRRDFRLAPFYQKRLCAFILNIQIWFKRYDFI